jgi:hypothetical protein
MLSAPPGQLVIMAVVMRDCALLTDEHAACMPAMLTSISTYMH